MVSILIFGFLLGIVRFFRLGTATNFLACVSVIGDPNNEHRNDDIFENSWALASFIVILLLLWMLFDDQFTFGNGYISQQFGLIVPEDEGWANLGFSPRNALGVFAGICLGEATRHFIHLFDPVFERAIAGEMKKRNTWAALDPTTQASAEMCAMIYDLNARTGRIALAAFSAIYNLRDDQKTAVMGLFEENIGKPKRMATILKPVKGSFGAGSPAAFMFFEKIVKIGVASGHAGHRFIDRLNMLARTLGIDPNQAKTTLEGNGFTANTQRSTAGSKSRYQDQYKSSQSYQSEKRARTFRPLNDTERHLAVLGLKKGASQKDIKSAYRKLAKKYHPDVLKSKQLSEAQMAKAAQTMLEINAAYEWLED